MSDLTCDCIGGGRISLYQPVSGIRAGSSSVLLAQTHFLPSENIKILDVGVGTGVIGLLLAQRFPSAHIYGIDVQPFYVDLSQKSAHLNGLQNYHVSQGDVKDFPHLYGQSFFHHVVSNPPFYPFSASRPCKDSGKEIGWREKEVSLQVWIRKCLSVLKHKGTLTLLIPVARLTEILYAIEERAGEATLFPLYARQTKEADLMIFRCKKGSKSPLRMTQGLIIHGDEKGYSERTRNILDGHEEIIL